MIDDEDIFDGYGTEVILEHRNDFLKIMETLTRIGIADKRTKTLYQTCHILHKRDRYAIIHFKELLALDGQEIEPSVEDIARRDGITRELERFKLLKIRFPDELWTGEPQKFSIIKHKDKSDWTLVSKHSLGRNKY